MSGFIHLQLCTEQPPATYHPHTQTNKRSCDLVESRVEMERATGTLAIIVLRFLGNTMDSIWSVASSLPIESQVGRTGGTETFELCQEMMAGECEEAMTRGWRR